MGWVMGFGGYVGYPWVKYGKTSDLIYEYYCELWNFSLIYYFHDTFNNIDNSINVKGHMTQKCTLLLNIYDKEQDTCHQETATFHVAALGKEGIRM